MCGGSVSIGYSAISSRAQSQAGAADRIGARGRNQGEAAENGPYHIIKGGSRRSCLIGTICTRLRVAPEPDCIATVGSGLFTHIIEFSVDPAAFLHRKPQQCGSAHYAQCNQNQRRHLSLTFTVRSAPIKRALRERKSGRRHRPRLTWLRLPASCPRVS